MKNIITEKQQMTDRDLFKMILIACDSLNKRGIDVTSIIDETRSVWRELEIDRSYDHEQLKVNLLTVDESVKEVA